MLDKTLLILFAHCSQENASEFLKQIYDKYYKLVYFIAGKYLKRECDIEDVVIETLSNLGIGSVINKSDNTADLLIDNEPWEIKAFNKQINEKTGTVLKGISFTYKQTQSEEGYPIIFVQYEMKDSDIVIKDVNIIKIVKIIYVKLVGANASANISA